MAVERWVKRGIQNVARERSDHWIGASKHRYAAWYRQVGPEGEPSAVTAERVAEADRQRTDFGLDAIGRHSDGGASLAERGGDESRDVIGAPQRGAVRVNLCLHLVRRDRVLG